MKFNKAKIVLSGIILGLTVLIMPVFAATLDMRPNTNTTSERKENEVVYDLYLVGVKKDEPITNLTINITDTSNNPNIRNVKRGDNLSNARCDRNGCYDINIAADGDFKIAEITLTNNTANQIDNLILTASATGYSSASSQAISLKGVVITPETTAPKLSSKAEITGLTLSAGTLDPGFSENVTSYKITGIKDTINSITFNHTCESCTLTYICKENCSISNSRSNRVLLEEGANVLRIVSDSQDGTNSKEYVFTIYRGEVEEPSAYLKDLKIKDVNISPKFDMLLNDYTASVDKDVDKLDITYTLEDPEAKVEVKGADKLKDGENTITITVTSSDGNSKQVYTIVVTREDICDPEKEDCDKEEKPVEETKIAKKKSNKLWLIILLSVVAIAIIVGSWLLLFKKKKKKNKDGKDKKNGKGNKLKEMLIEPDDIENNENSEDTEENIEEPKLDESLENDILDNYSKEPEIIKPKVKPSVDEALEDLMKTKEIELNE